MKELLLKKKEELDKSMQSLVQEIAKLQEQATLQRGAYYYNDMLLSELEAKENSKE